LIFTLQLAQILDFRLQRVVRHLLLSFQTLHMSNHVLSKDNAHVLCGLRTRVNATNDRNCGI
jgi:hypothetical protein